MQEPEASLRVPSYHPPLGDTLGMNEHGPGAGHFMNKGLEGDSSLSFLGCSKNTMDSLPCLSDRKLPACAQPLSAGGQTSPGLG